MSIARDQKVSPQRTASLIFNASTYDVALYKMTLRADNLLSFNNHISWRKMRFVQHTGPVSRKVKIRDL
jgi:hypothetical protein